MAAKTILTFLAAALTASIVFAGAPSMAADDLMLDSKLQSMKKAGVGPVKFPHTFHKKKLKCSVCHPGIFIDKKGANDISMKKNMEQKFCGSANCHNSQNAFPLFECVRCHTNVKAAR